ncbi:MAG: hypothetical protein ACI8S6_005983 [Myxococcota bacterium]
MDIQFSPDSAAATAADLLVIGISEATLGAGDLAGALSSLGESAAAFATAARDFTA